MGAAGEPAGGGWPARLAALRSQAHRAAVAEGIAAFRRLPVDRSTIMYESFGGNGILCGPEAILRSLLGDPRHTGMRHVLALDDPRRHPRTVGEFAGDPRVTLVTRMSASYFRTLSTAGLLVNNATFPAQFAKRAGQVYLNTWHGTPLKAMGYDVPGGGPSTANVVRNLLQADYLVSASPFMTETLYASAYRLRNLFRGTIIEEGYPRVDRQFVPPADARGLLGVDLPGTTRVVLYAPTWQGESFREPLDQTPVLAARVEELSRCLGVGWTVLIKVHQVAHAQAAAFPGLADRLVDNDIPANVALAAADVLVTDYSSLAVDLLTLDRPVVFLSPDLPQYQRERGLYLSPGQLPGPVHADVESAARSIREAVEGGSDAELYAERRAALRERLAPHEDGSATQRVVDVVLRGEREGHRLVDISSDGRRRLLIYLGGMKSNGITTSALSLLRQLDHSAYDVTAFFAHSVRREQAGNIAGIDPRVRLLPRVGSMNGSKSTHLVRHIVERRGVSLRADRMPLGRLFGDEWARCFGSATFDSIVDFAGYAPFWTMLVLRGRADHRAVWMHNDMVADSLRVVDGRRPLRASLRSVFTTYRFFDSLVSVSPALRDVNLAALARYAQPDQFTFALNTIDAGAVLASASAGGGTAAQPATLLPPAPPGTATFVTAGRLSSQKNFERMISAFALLRRDHPATRLVILGEGPERSHLEQHIARLGVADGVLLLGHQPDPFPVMAQCDCFVLSSDHEGQPMVILEARVLGLPVVTTGFASVRGALPEGTGLVVPMTVRGVRDGMAAFLRGEVPHQAFDAEAYNREALRQFCAAVGLSGSPADPRGGRSADTVQRPPGSASRGLVRRRRGRSGAGSGRRPAWDPDG